MSARTLMLEARFPRVLNLDNSVVEDFGTPEPGSRDAFLRCDLHTLGPRLRYACGRGALRRFRQALSPADRSRLTFYGSGDFHHLTAELLRAFTEPLSLIIFDQHPDWDVTSPWACCGSWLNSALQMPHVQRVVVIGLGPEDLHGWHLLRGNTRALREGRLKLYPASWRVSRDGAGYRRFETVRAQGMDALMSRVIEQLPTRQVYVSIDKDCLSPRWAASNWADGELELSEVLSALAQLGANCQIVGADVTGEWSPGEPQNPLLRLLARADHPHQPMPTPAQLRTNARTNRALHAAFLSATQASTQALTQASAPLSSAPAAALAAPGTPSNSYLRVSRLAASSRAQLFLQGHRHEQLFLD